MSGAGTGQVQGLRTVSSHVETKINKRKRDKMKRHKPSLRPDTKPAQIVCQSVASFIVYQVNTGVASLYLYIDSSG